MITRSSELFPPSLQLNEDEIAAIDRLVPIRQHAAGDILLREGAVARESYFLLSGCIRSYYLVDGIEKTTAFYTESEPVASHKSYMTQTPANHFLACVEDCTVVVMEYHAEQELYRDFPRLESVCRMSMEEEFGKQQEQMANFIMSSAEDRYLELLEKRGDLVHRVPQYQLASYLGIKPESLSRIRKRIAQRTSV
ncbi:MAG: Crp/Fnr family transcriptional regulator [Saprospiraceae bacterium]|nr:Crp/Fnr family transcriptional regulator [Saprospiraceae bacterium]